MAKEKGCINQLLLLTTLLLVHPILLLAIVAHQDEGRDRCVGEDLGNIDCLRQQPSSTHLSQARDYTYTAVSTLFYPSFIPSRPLHA